MKTVFIYSESDPRTGKICYIGKTNDIRYRHRSHVSSAARGEKSHKGIWIRELLALGLVPEIEIIDEVPVEEWEFWEREYIKVYRLIGLKLVNSTDGGGGKPDGRFDSEQTRAKKSAARKGNKNPNFGKPMTEAQKEKIRTTLTGRRATPEARKNMSVSRMGNKSHTGRTFSEEHLQNLGKSQTGRRHSEATKLKMAESGRQRWARRKAQNGV